MHFMGAFETGVDVVSVGVTLTGGEAVSDWPGWDPVPSVVSAGDDVSDCPDVLGGLV
ncbi:hypothetical protein ACIP9X_21655 [Arthrobacter sp. NPDC093125]|uniref:hypothetical protein n=1 Tax=Arthrobacter sp. NPDC093125 TaxID=3363944 RepID=UPI00381B1CEF